MTNKTCSVVIVSYYTGPALFAAINSVLKQAQLADLVVVNNGNPLDALARLQQIALTQTKLKIVTGQGNVGFAKGCNAGARVATGDYLMLLNPDCLLPPNALVEMMAGLNEVPDARLAGCFVVNPDGTEQRGARRQFLTPSSALAETLRLPRFLGFKRLNDRVEPMPRETHEVPAISGACMCIRANDYQRLFGMDEGFFLHVEDLDLCARVYRGGGKVICVPRVRATHMLSTSGETSNAFIEWQKARGFIRYFNKHFKGMYFPGFLSLINLSILARFVLRVATYQARRALRGKPALIRTVPAKRLMILASGLAELPVTSDLQGKVVLVTGATSQVGLCVTRRLLASGAAVLAISRADPIPFEHERLRWIKGDLTDANLHLHGYLADIIIHCAPLWHLPPTLDLLADAEIERVIAFGSTSVFAKAASRNEYEQGIVEKHRKSEEEIAERCAARNMLWTVLRPTLVYGVGLDLNITSLAKFIRRFGVFYVYPPARGRRQPVHADDLAIAALQVLFNQTTYNKAYNVSGGEIVTYRDMLERIFKLCRKRVNIRESKLTPFMMTLAGVLLRKKHINGEIARRMNDDLVFFHDDAKRDFGFTPRSFLSGGIKDIEGF